MEDKTQWDTPKMVGARVSRREDWRFLTGHGSYVDDYRPPGLLHAAFLRSPHAHATIEHIETAAARAMPGVVAVITGDELARMAKPVRAASRMSQYRETGFPPLAVGKVRYMGEAVTAVVAESRYIAEDALDAILVDYDPLPAVVDATAACESESAILHDEAESNVLLAREFSSGDVEAAIAAADVRVRDRFRFHRHAVVCMENRGCVAEFHSGRDELILRSATQCPGLLRDALAELLDIPEHLVRVIAPDVGGGFGTKSSLYPEELAICALARMLLRPVKWISDRREDLLTSTQAWDEIVEAELALRSDGTIIGLRAEVTSDIGAYSIYPWTASVEPIQVISFLPGPYRVSNYTAHVRGVATCKAPVGPYRGVGRPVTTFAMEGLMDRAARQLGMDSVALRRLNYIQEADFPYRTPSGIVWDQASLTPCMDRAVDELDYPALQTWQTQARAEGRWVGIGFATYIELTGVGSAIPASPGASISTGTEAAFLRVDPSGKVTAAFSLAPQGQGNETTLAQVIADELGVPMDDVRVVCGDTAIAPHGTGTYASRSAVLAGGAAILAGREIRAKALTIAAHLLEANPDDLNLQEGQITVRGTPDRGVSFREVAQAAYGGLRRLPPDVEPGLEVTRFYDPYYGTASSATHIVVAEVDRQTYEVTLHRYVVVEDCGRLINPLIVDGQVRGGVAQGIGAALYEEVIYDDHGQLLSGTLMDYLVPTASEVIEIDIHHLETPSPTTLGGFRGMGEGGTIGAPAAIANAVSDALSPFGIDINEMPITPDRLHQLIRTSTVSSV